MSDLRTDTDDLFAEIHELVTARIEGRLTPEQFGRFEELLHRSEEARALYVQYIYETLTLPILTQPPSDVFRAATMGQGTEAGGPEEVTGGLLPASIPLIAPPTLPYPDPVSPVVPAPGLIGHAWRGTVGFFSQEVPFAILLTTLIFALLGVLASSITFEHYVQMPGRHEMAGTEKKFGDKAGKEKQVAELTRRNVKPVARITCTIDCKWANADQAPLIEEVALHDKFALASGLMEISYYTGAKVILQGPCSYEVDSPTGGFLSGGKLTARCEKRGERKESSGQNGAKGEKLLAKNETDKPQKSAHPSSVVPPALFAVRTPTAIVTDLGTEFGVEVRGKSVTQTHVMRGTVSVQAIEKGVPAGKPVVLSAHHSAHVEKGNDGKIVLTSKEEKVNPSQYVREVAPASTVLAYWRFEDGSPNDVMPDTNRKADFSRWAVRDESKYGNHLYIFSAGAKPKWTRDVPTALIPATGMPNRGALDDRTPPSEDRPTRDLFTSGHVSRLALDGFRFEQFTIEASFNFADGDGRQTILCKTQQGVPSLTGRPPLSLSRLENGRMEMTVLNDSHHSYKVTSLGTIKPGVWHHIAVVYDGRKMTMYLKGPGDADYIEQNSVTFAGPLLNIVDHWVVGAGWPVDQPAEDARALLDEIRISGVALKPYQFLFSSANSQ